LVGFGLAARFALLLKLMIVGAAVTGVAFAWAQERNRAQPKSKAPECWVSEFREMALTTHVVGERERKALAWISQYGQQCSDEQLLMLVTNRPSWLGNADTARVAGAIDRELERRYVAGRGKVESLFDSPATKPGETQTITTPEAPAPVVPGTQATTAPDAVVVQQPAPSN
jgi:hypothetical protein